jgi:hypothetical protein
MPVDPQYLVLSLLLVAPGFVAVIIAITLGVVERDLSNFTMLVVSIVSSILIDSVFLAIVYRLGADVSTIDSIRTLFFTPIFRADFVFLLFGISVIFGLGYSLGLVFDIHHILRERFWRLNDRKRHPWQPWEGTLRDAYMVQVITSDRELVVGELGEYSRVNKSRQLRLENPEWMNQETGQLEPDGSESVLLLEEDIDRVYVRLSEEGRKNWVRKNADGEDK